MVNRRNSGDSNFYFDSSLQNDHRKADNATIASDNEIRLATYGGNRIGEGLVLSDGTNPGTIAISPGWAVDDLGSMIIVPTAIDNLALLDATGRGNSIAICYTNTYADPRVARGNGVEYNTTICDSYTIDVALAQQPVGIAPYWVRLGIAERVGAAAGVYKMEEATGIDARAKHWRKNPFWDRSFGWSDLTGPAPAAIAIPAAETWLFHQGVNTAVMKMSYDGYIDRLHINTSAAPGQIVTWRVRINGALAFTVTQAAVATDAQVIYAPATAAVDYTFAMADTIHVTAEGALATAPVQAIATVGGCITGW